MSSKTYKATIFRDQSIIDALLMFARSFGTRIGDKRWML